MTPPSVAPVSSRHLPVLHGLRALAALGVVASTRTSYHQVTWLGRSLCPDLPESGIRAGWTIGRRNAVLSLVALFAHWKLKGQFSQNTAPNVRTVATRREALLKVLEPIATHRRGLASTNGLGITRRTLADGA